MRRFLALAMLLSLAPPVAASAQTTAPASSATPAPAASVDPKVEAIAKDWLAQIQANKIDRTQLTEQASAQFTPDLVKQVSDQLAPLGAPTAFTYLGSQVIQGMTLYKFRVVFGKQAVLNEGLMLDAAGKVAGLQFAPAQ
jgi:hypothetical protein